MNSPNEEVDALNDLDPLQTAVVLTSEFGEYVANFDPNKNGSIELTSYTPIRLEYRSNSQSEQVRQSVHRTALSVPGCKPGIFLRAPR